MGVREDQNRDRVTCDRRPQISEMSSFGRVLLHFCPRFRLVLDRSPSAQVSGRTDNSSWNLYGFGPPVRPRTLCSHRRHLELFQHVSGGCFALAHRCVLVQDIDKESRDALMTDCIEPRSDTSRSRES